MPAGTLFIVATPIGNLEDLSFRALRTLKEVQLIAAEDTRRTGKLLSHYQIRCPMVSLREHNEHRNTPGLLARLQAGESIALVTDAGTPTISDPGSGLVRAAREVGIRVVPIPGPSAVTTALAASGFPADRFAFMGFAPRSGSARETWLAALSKEPGTVVFFESPHRVAHALEEVKRAVGKRPILALRELTKIHESLVLYPIQSVPSKGEFTIVVGPMDAGASSADQPQIDPGLASGLLEHLVGQPGLTREKAEVMVAKALDSDQVTVRKLVKQYRISVKQQNR